MFSSVECYFYGFSHLIPDVANDSKLWFIWDYYYYFVKRVKGTGRDREGGTSM